MQLGQTLGLVAGALVACSMIPQLVRVFRLKSAHEVSRLFTILLLAGMICWIAYGIYFRLIPVILWNSISTGLVVLLLYAKLKYGR